MLDSNVTNPTFINHTYYYRIDNYGKIIQITEYLPISKTNSHTIFDYEFTYKKLKKIFFQISHIILATSLVKLTDIG